MTLCCQQVTHNNHVQVHHMLIDMTTSGVDYLLDKLMTPVDQSSQLLGNQTFYSQFSTNPLALPYSSSSRMVLKVWKTVHKLLHEINLYYHFQFLTTAVDICKTEKLITVFS